MSIGCINKDLFQQFKLFKSFQPWPSPLPSPIGMGEGIGEGSYN